MHHIHETETEQLHLTLLFIYLFQILAFVLFLYWEITTSRDFQHFSFLL